MKDQVLTIEKMQHLKELGVDTSKASVYWVKRSHGSDIRDESKGEWSLSLHKDFIVCGFISYEVIPTLTVYDMLEMMPRTIPLYPIRCISLWYDEGWCISYSGCEDAGSINNESPLDAAYNMLCWLAENKLLGKEEKK